MVLRFDLKKYYRLYFHEILETAFNKCSLIYQNNYADDISFTCVKGPGFVITVTKDGVYSLIVEIDQAKVFFNILEIKYLKFEYFNFSLSICIDKYMLVNDTDKILHKAMSVLYKYCNDNMNIKSIDVNDCIVVKRMFGKTEEPRDFINYITRDISLLEVMYYVNTPIKFGIDYSGKQYYVANLPEFKENYRTKVLQVNLSKHSMTNIVSTDCNGYTLLEEKRLC
jgi:hypothetical protein